MADGMLLAAAAVALELEELRSRFFDEAERSASRHSAMRLYQWRASSGVLKPNVKAV